ncbi:MAG: CCA tRNA nucleotidyltransferase [Chitinophagia bacterium]|nr:CCA tRNA nucleotidyltransferase [Chitinophagia bacterium]
MEITFTENELTLFTWIGKCADKLNIECHLIGGCVRDKLLHRPTKDADIVCSGSGIELAHAVAEGLQPTPAVSYFKNFGTAHFRYQGMEVEFVGARKESYHAHSRKPDVEPGSMEDDRLRRDFTINALGIALNSHNFGTLSDAFNGLQHLEDGIIVTPTDPDITFSDDPLRMMRAIRFATQLGFTIAPHVLDAITRNADRIKIISQERITDELNKIMAAAKPSVGFHLLYVTKLLPHFSE